MARPRNAQEFMHWLEVGSGARWIRRLATLLIVCVLSLWVAWKQFHGATSESTMIEADMGRQLASGEGFTTLVNYPQSVAFLEARGVKFNVQHPLPELSHAPLYPIVIAGALRVLPHAVREGLFDTPPTPPDGAPGDYVLLGLNIVLLWLAAWLTFDLARRLFDVRAAWLSVFALVLSVGVWQQTLAITGATLLMVLALAAFTCWQRVEQCLELLSQDESATQRDRAEEALWQWQQRQCRVGLWWWLGGLGVSCGLLFLTEYSAGALLLVACGYAITRFRPAQRWFVLLTVVGGFVVVAAPWVTRNLLVSGSPVGLAIQNVALKAGDPTAEPANVRNTLAAALPAIDLNKLGNKTLTSVQESVKSRIWAGGAMWLLAFFATGWLYPFRAAATNRLRWIFTISFAVLLLAQAALNSGESDRVAAGWLAPLVIVFGAGFFFVLLGSNEGLRLWPRSCVAVVLLAQALPLVHDALEPRRLHFQYPPYFPGLFIGMRQELVRRDHGGRFGIMADVPAGVAWYSRQRVWSQPVKLHDFYAITLEQPLGELLLTPRTLDRPFFSDLAARPSEPSSLARATNLFGEWGRIYAGLFTGGIPPEFPLSAPQKLSENLYVLLNPALPPPSGK